MSGPPTTPLCGPCPDREKMPDGTGPSQWHMEKCGYYGDRLKARSGRRIRCAECLDEKRLELVHSKRVSPMTPSYNRVAPNTEASKTETDRAKCLPQRPLSLYCGQCPERDVVETHNLDNRGKREVCGWYAEPIKARGTNNRLRCLGCLTEGRPDHAK